MNNTNIFFTRYYHFHTTTLHIAFTKFLGWGCDFVSPWSKFFFFSPFWGGLLFILGVCWDRDLTIFLSLTLELRSENACNANAMQREVAGWVLQWVVICWLLRLERERGGMCDVIRPGVTRAAPGGVTGQMSGQWLQWLGRPDCTHSANQRLLVDINDQSEAGKICTSRQFDPKRGKTR